MTAMASMPAFAATYYVTPDGAGTKDGSSWENAFGVAEFRTKASTNVNGDVYYFEGGLYNLSESTVIFNVGTGATLIGNADGERTIFSGDKDGNNNPDSTDAGRLIRFQANTVHGNSTNKIIIDNIDFTCVYTWEDDDHGNMTALMIDNSGDVVIKNCHFYNNWAQGQYGGAAAFLYRSSVRLENCIFYNNSANYRGGALRICSNHVDKGIITIDNCVFKNNRNYHTFGGAIFMGHGNSINIINSTIANNQAASDGGAIYFNGYNDSFHCELRIVNSTIAGNTTDADNDAQIVSTQGAHINIANSIIPNDEEEAAIMFKGDTENENFEFVSGGYNYVGNIIDNVDKELVWQDTDVHGEGCSYEAIFGNNTLNSDNVIIPDVFYQGATGEQVKTAVASWGLPDDINYDVDQLGNQRTGDISMGAYAAEKESISTSIIELPHYDNSLRLISDGSSIYTVEGYDGMVNVYSVSGALVLKTIASNINLMNQPNGLYIIEAGNTIFKVIR